MPESRQFGSPPPFHAFYEALNGRPPFPWQSRLADHVQRVGAWPQEIGVPTGLGKTACLDVAVWWLASQAGCEPVRRTAPTRIWWIVNRRMLVDSTFEHAERIREELRRSAEAGAGSPGVEPLRAVADRLRSFSADPAAEPLEVIRLRGGVDSRRPTDPSRPCIILSTVPMYGSRLLFRGYGTWRSLRPVDAALAGVDSLVLVDEAHLARHLMRLVPALSECTAGAERILGPGRSRPQVVALTATGDASASDRFDLDPRDEAHPTVRGRLDASKPVEVLVSRGDPGLRLAESARNLLARGSGPGRSCIVFANTPATARAVFRCLQSMFPADSADLLLLTGRTRGREAERIRQRILDSVHGIAAERDSTQLRERHLIVVATQTLEVGADVDAEHLVTEACGVRALTQRLGRLNRMGRFPGATGTYVHLPPPRRSRGPSRGPDTWPVYGLEPATVLEKLLAAADPETRVASLPPRSVARILGTPRDDPGRAPEVLHGILYEWVKTTTPPSGEAPVEPYFAGISGFDSSVSLVWRAHVPGEGDRIWPRASDREALSVPIRDVRDAFDEGEKLRRIAADGVTVESMTARDMRPGDVIVIASDRGLLDDFGWEPGASSPVLDLSIATHGLPLDADALGRLFKDATRDPFDGIELLPLVDRVLGHVPGDEDPDPDDGKAAVAELVGILERSVPAEWEESAWHEFLASVGRDVVIGRREVPRLPVLERPMDDAANDDLDERSLAEPVTATELEAHGRAVAARARSIGKRVGLSPELVEVVETAGRLHDLGKADRRFQRWLDPLRTSTVPLAKSGMKRHLWRQARVAAGWPAGGRHEALSSRLVRRWMEHVEAALPTALRDLLVHLVISHHGFGRPLVPPVTDGTPEVASTDVRGERIEVPADLSLIDWDQPARFRGLNDRFGPWGLALLEAVVRQADHSVSAGAQMRELESEE